MKWCHKPSVVIKRGQDMQEKILVGHKLRRFRQSIGLSQTAMSEALDISPSYLNLLEHNQRPLTVTLLLKLGNSFDIDLKSFAEDDSQSLIADMSEIFTDPLFTGEAVSRRELQDLISAAPGAARSVIKLFHAYRMIAFDAVLHDGSPLCALASAAMIRQPITNRHRTTSSSSRCWRKRATAVDKSGFFSVSSCISTLIFPFSFRPRNLKSQAFKITGIYSHPNITGLCGGFPYLSEFHVYCARYNVATRANASSITACSCTSASLTNPRPGLPVAVSTPINVPGMHFTA